MKKIKLNFTQSFIPFILIFAFPSCSTDNKDVSSESTLKKVTLSKNIEAFSSYILKSNLIIQQELSKNDHLLFDANFVTTLYNSKNEDEIKKTFENSGMKNSEVILNLLKNQLNAKLSFKQDNPILYKLNLEKRKELFNKSFDDSFIKFSNSLISEKFYTNIFQKYDVTPPTNTTDCIRVYNKQLGRCDRDFGFCGGFAIVAAGFTGGTGGLISAAYCMTTHYICKDDAKQNLYECVMK
jgi:hypothetical protein